ncbi:MAG: hypothetical protein IPJ18_05205 [Betaproteobacteria bacterium]|nr:hypothetical protein [Betaproteobacteria bacterium]
MRALFIKLGEGGRWELDCIRRDATLRFGYQEIPHSVCERARQSGDWSEVEAAARAFSKDKGSATRHVNQVREFYEAGEDVLWITFHSDRLWWCFSKFGVTGQPGEEKLRRVAGKWSDEDIKGQPLLKGRISGRLLAVQGFMGTICSVSELEYLLCKINGNVEPHVATAQSAFENLQEALVPIIRRLHHKDLEILADLIFRQSGWQRVGVSGGTEKDIDLDLISPVTGERVAAQVKSRAGADVWRAYRTKYADMRGYSGSISSPTPDRGPSTGGYGRGRHGIHPLGCREDSLACCAGGANRMASGQGLMRAMDIAKGKSWAPNSSQSLH